MKKSYPKISYDKEGKILSLEIGKEKSVDSDIRGNVVIDYNRKGVPVRIDVHNFSFDSFREARKDLKHFERSQKHPVLTR